MKKALILLATVFIMLVALTGCSISGSITEITIFHTNDTHGRVVGDGEYVIGIDRIAAIHKNTPDSILVDAGDTFHGLPVATVNGGADIAELMKAAGYTAMALGNHEFNYGWERLIDLREIAGFPFLASNVTLNGADFLDDTYMIDKGGVKIGLFGITTEATSYSAMPDFVRGVTFSDPVLTAQTRSDYLREQGAVIIIALCHLGDTPYDGTLSTELAEKVPEIDVIIDGHSHSELPYGLDVNGVLIAQTGDHGNNLGKVTVFVEKGKIISKIAEFITVEEAMETAPDETVESMLAAIRAGIDVILNEPLGESFVTMSSERSPGVRTQEMPLGSLVADAYRSAAFTDIAIVNGGDIRADLSEGIITKGDVISILPFGNTLMVKNVTPSVLYRVLENGVSGIITDYDSNIDHEQSAQGRFLHVSGFSFAYDPSAPVGERIVSVILDDGRELSAGDNSTVISLVSSNYIMTGGDEYYILADLPVLHELGSADEALSAYIRKYSPIDAPLPGRLMTLDEYLQSRGSTIMLYTSMKDTLIGSLVDAFEAKHENIKIDTRIAGAGTLMTEIKAENEGDGIKADVIWTSEIPDFYTMKNDGLLLQYTPAGAENILNPLTDTDGYFYPARLGTMGIAYNTDLVEAPRFWQDLLKSEFTDGFAIADPSTSGTALMSVVLLSEAFGNEFFSQLRANGAFIGQGSTQVVEAVAAGELAACLAVDYITFDKMKSGAPIAMAYPDELIVIPSPMAIFKDSPNAESAKKFIDYMITPDAQRIIATIGTLPVLREIPTTNEFNVPSVAEAMSRAIEVDTSAMMTWKDDLVREFLEIMG